MLAAVVVAGLWLVGSRLEWERLADLGSVHGWSLLAAAAALHLMTLPLKALGWRIALGAVHPETPLTTRVVAAPVATGALVNLAVPGRVGDALRILLVHGRLRRSGRAAPLSTVTGSAVTETLVSTAAWVALVAAVGLIVPLPWAAWCVLVLAAGGVGLIALAAWRGWGGGNLARHTGLVARAITASRRVWMVVVEGHRTLRQPTVLVPLVGTAAAGWVVQWAGIVAVLVAFDVADAARAATLVLASTSVALMVPLVPGNLGVFQAAAAVPLVASTGVAPATAIAIGMVLQLVQSAPIALAGSIAAIRQGEDVRLLWGSARGFGLGSRGATS